MSPPAATTTIVPHGGNPLSTMEATVQDLRLAEALGYAPSRHPQAHQAPPPDAGGARIGAPRWRANRIGQGPRLDHHRVHLTKAQAAFITAKAGTKQADSLTALMAEVFAMAADGRLVAANEAAAKELAEAQARELRRRHEEERDARSAAFAPMR